MLAVSEALALVLQRAARRAPTTADLFPNCLGLVLAEDIVSDIDMPPYDKSLMDGYAVRMDAGPDAPLRVVEEIAAGHVPARSIGPGETARIMTGAMIPNGTEAVVMVERTETLADGRVRIQEKPGKAGQNILPRGREMKAGETILTAGTMLRPQELGMLATVGCVLVSVYQRPTVAILSTGDEVVEPKAKPQPGQIRNSNATMLAAQVARAGASPCYVGIARDTAESLCERIEKGLKEDVLLLSGGVSMGTLDLVPGVLQEFGVEPVFHKVAMKPGKPLFFGVKGDTLVFGLPGNPVSSLVGFELFVRPALRMMAGQKESGPTMVRAALTAEFAYRTDRQTYHPARLEMHEAGWRVTPVSWFGSADLRSIGGANAFAVFAVGDHRYELEAIIDVLAPEL